MATTPRRIGTALAALTTTLLAVPVVATAQSPAPLASANDLNDLAACLGGSSKLDVIVMLDETESLIHRVKDGVVIPTEPGSDVPHHRITAAQSFIEELLQKQEDEGFRAQVKLAGFGQEYRNDTVDPAAYGGWTELNASGARDLKGRIAAAEDRTWEEYTNYANAMRGAYQDFSRSGTENSCKLLVTFTDGSLTAAGRGDAAGRAQAEICEPGGIADQFRIAGITHIGIGLSNPDNPSDFSLFRAITTGEGEIPCGAQPANGAFHDSQSVGQLFAAFHQALETGGNVTEETSVENGFTFLLDKSIDSVRFTALAQDNLGSQAYLTLTTPDGQTHELREQSPLQLGGAEVAWTSTNDPVNKVSGELRLSDAATPEQREAWEGAWTMKFAGYDDGTQDGRVLNSVTIQPDLNVSFRADGANVEARESGISMRETDKLSLALIDHRGRIRSLDGAAIADVRFNPTGSDASISLLEGVDISGGQPIEIPLSALGSLPAQGQITAAVTVSTKGKDDQPGTTLDPVQGRTGLAVSTADLPQLPEGLSLSMNDTTAQLEIPVTGPGLVWVDTAAGINANLLPQGVNALRVSSPHNTRATALSLKAGEKAFLPVTLSADALRDGMINATVPVALAELDAVEDAPAKQTGTAAGQATLPAPQAEAPRPDGVGPFASMTHAAEAAAETTPSSSDLAASTPAQVAPRMVNVALQGAMSVPVDASIFVAALVAALLLALALPLLLAYLVRWVSAKVPPRFYAALRVPVRRVGAQVQFAGQPQLVLDPDQAAAHQVPRAVGTGRSLHLAGYDLKVHSFNLNPLARPRVIVENAPSVAASGAQHQGHAVLPVAVQGSWFLAAPQEPGEDFNLVILPALPLNQESAAQLAREIELQVPGLLQHLEAQLPPSLVQPPAPEGRAEATPWA